MRYLRIFLLHTQEVFEERSRLLVWFLLSWITPLVLILFWRGAKNLGGWTIEEIISYYLLVVVMGVLLMPHHEEKIALIDIQEGGLTAYLLKPFSYFQIRFFGEISSRLIQGFFGLVLLFLFIQVLPSYFVLTNSPVIIALSILLAIFSLALNFIFKTIIGMLAFWMTETRGAFEATEATLALLAGFWMPVAFLPDWVQSFVYFLPFPYMIYFPIIAFEGKLTVMELLHVMGVQIIWIIILFLLYKKVWKEGIKKYTAVGQ